jgi:hypothetical protein
MEYRGTEFQVVQTSNPTGWKWTVHAVGRRIRTGSAINRIVAIALAHRAIDKLLKSEPAAGTVPPDPSIESQEVARISAKHVLQEPLK